MNNWLKAGLTAAACLAGPAVAQADFPERAVTLVVAQPAGGPSDVFARIVAEKAGAILGQPVVVENRPGANSMAAYVSMSNARPDGYSVLLSTSGANAFPALFKSFTLDLGKDLTPVALLSSGPLAVFANPKTPFDTLDDLVAHAKAHPGELNYANISAGSLLPAEMLKQATGIDFVTVNYNGGAPSYQAVMTGEADFLLTTLGAGKPMVDSGQLKAISVNTAKRSDLAPDIPALGESKDPQIAAMAEFGGFAEVWFAIVGPKGLDPENARILGEAFRKAVEDPQVSEKIRSVSQMVPAPADAAELGKRIEAEQAQWLEIAKTAGIMPQ
ncbi:Bug family tripartite tricarboxylate transporter substrate binding protein [Paracoccus pantotrophus]|uniref:Bug family tripartite tricarboxylate transporter substrate binding protein n=1 Tax=Paracoccus pantotrophus TaxID=82367 RepID=UPI0004ACBB80|nr:tripartite tricarboxylate transporter substrate binding protein [Paracoccus pantotrophus]